MYTSYVINHTHGKSIYKHIIHTYRKSIKRIGKKKEEHIFICLFYGYEQHW